tara:strand:- start:5437 stop:6276 length:840 start_codon:yes stop_codon:yes gene_type:complete
MIKVGIVGQGFVGTAIREGLKDFYKIETFDLKEKCTCESLSDLVNKTNTIFVCVPTPMRKDGSCDTTIVESVISEINTISMEDKIVIIKSTVPPGTTERLNNNRYSNLQVVFNPEFLTEANSINDFKNQNRIIIGGPRPASTKVRQLFSKAFPKIPIIKTHSTIAEMVKYMTNTFLSTKVSFANEIYMICDELGIDYDKVIEYATYDDRLGKSHWSVPGPDGKKGFGGSCFPKDLNAILDVCRQLGVPAKTLYGAWETNLKVRPEQDWKELKGRAVTDE